MTPPVKVDHDNAELVRQIAALFAQQSALLARVEQLEREMQELTTAAGYAVEASEEG